jgi:hypothetical protein
MIWIVRTLMESLISLLLVTLLSLAHILATALHLHMMSFVMMTCMSAADVIVMLGDFPTFSWRAASASMRDGRVGQGQLASARLTILGLVPRPSGTSGASCRPSVPIMEASAMLVLRDSRTSSLMMESAPPRTCSPSKSPPRT